MTLVVSLESGENQILIRSPTGVLCLTAVAVLMLAEIGKRISCATHKAAGSDLTNPYVYYGNGKATYSFQALVLAALMLASHVTINTGCTCFALSLPSVIPPCRK